jgi:sigma-B regulation protein RsbQ
VPTLVLQCREDALAPPSVGAYVHEHVAGSTLTVLDTVGHCPHLSAPDQTIAAMRAFLGPPAGP